jgi:hypothetical protein
MNKSSVLCGIAISLALGGVGQAEEPDATDQSSLNQMVIKDPGTAFHEAFEAGDELTEADFTKSRGVGANVTDGLLFSRIPRADLGGDSEWAMHLPMREGGPNATSCISCHSSPIDNGAGGVAQNVVVDPLHTGDPAQYLERNTLHLFALGAPQRIAEEMTTELHDQRDSLREKLCDTGGIGTVRLTAKTTDFGELGGIANGTGEDCRITFDYGQISGIDDDLVVRPFGWKGNHATIRSFTRSAAHNELGMQAVELVGSSDGDGDGVTNELSIGDLTALSVYMAALERPTSKVELADLGLVPISAEERSAIAKGSDQFVQTGCAACHTPELLLDMPIFQEPSAHAAYREDTLPSGMPAKSEGLDAVHAIRFDLTNDQPNNRIETATGEVRLGSFAKASDGRMLVRWYSDFKRHDMGPELADPVDAFGYGASVWPTRSLAGVGSTGPWLHNGHATTLQEAIEAHGGEAADSRARYQQLASQDRENLIVFLNSLVIYKHDTGEEEEDH